MEGEPLGAQAELNKEVLKLEAGARDTDGEDNTSVCVGGVTGAHSQHYWILQRWSLADLHSPNASWQPLGQAGSLRAPRTHLCTHTCTHTRMPTSHAAYALRKAHAVALFPSQRGPKTLGAGLASAAEDSAANQSRC